MLQSQTMSMSGLPALTSTLTMRNDTLRERGDFKIFKNVKHNPFHQKNDYDVMLFQWIVKGCRGIEVSGCRWVSMIHPIGAIQLNTYTNDISFITYLK